MCLIAYAPAGARIPDESVEAGFDSNRDGFGILWREHVGARIHVVKGVPDSFHPILEALDAVPKGAEYALHLRYATHGLPSSDLCHPFPLGRNSYLMHNGILPEHAKHATESASDTLLFTQEIAPWFKGKKAPFDNPSFADLIKTATGRHSKLLFMARGAPVRIANRDLGEDCDGVWYSNDAFRPYLRAYLPASMATIKSALSQGSFEDVADFVQDDPNGATELLAELLGVERQPWYRD